MLKTFITLFLVLLTTTAFAGNFGSIACPKGKIEAKSGGAFYVPSTGNFGIQFFRDSLTEDQVDWHMAKEAKAILKSPIKKGPVGKEETVNTRVISIEGQLKNKGTRVSAEELAKDFYHFFYVCGTQWSLASANPKERMAVTKKYISKLSGDLKPGSKITIKTQGTFDGDPDTPSHLRTKVTLNIHGAVKLRVYE